MLGYAVIDCETTGLNRTGSDRIAEIAIATFDLDFNLTGKYETLLNPEQDLGLTSLHGIDGLMASLAPRFEEVMSSIANLLHDRIIIGQNVEFDLKFIAHEFGKKDIEILWKGTYLDTLQMAKEAQLPTVNNQLSTLCAHFGIPLLDAHSAMADVMATARLFQALVAMKPNRIPSLASPFQFPASQLPLSSELSKWTSREAVHKILKAPYDWEAFLHQLPRSKGSLSAKDIQTYLNTLHLALINDRHTYKEREIMEHVILLLSLSRSQVVNLNEEYLFLLLCRNLAHSGNHTPFDFSNMKTAIEFTGISEGRVQELLAETLENKHLIPGGLQTFQSLFSLTQGDGITISGEEFITTKQHLKTKLESAGFRVLPSVTKSGTKALITNDPYSLSNKAATARRFGIPIITEETVAKLIKGY